MTDTFHVSTRKGLFTFERGAAGFQIARTAFLGDTVSLAMSDPRDGALYAALGHGHFGVKLHRSRDGGRAWEEIATPAFPPKPEGPDELTGGGQVWPWRTEQIWALEPGLASQPGVLWCGTIPGGLFRSSDAGASWALVRGLWDHPRRKKWLGGGADYPGIHSIVVDPGDGDHVRVAVSCGGVWETRDGGATWNNDGRGMFAAFMPPDQREDPDIQDAHRMVACPDRPDALWIQHHNGVFRSRDGGARWDEIPNVSPSVFGFAVAVHPRDPDIAWLVPAQKDEKRIPVDGKVVVARTRDGGATWTVLRNGLPQEHAYDLVLRHALDVSASGDTLAFGSTTGSVWVTSDQGDHWECLSTHLPPVYAVRFVR